MRNGVFGIFRKILLLLFLFPGMALWSSPAFVTFPADIEWMQRESSHFKILYRKGQGAFALRTLRAAEKAHKILSPIFPKGPDTTWIVLADFKDSVNGYALNLPYPHMAIFAAPPANNGPLSSTDYWLESIVLHEYVHILHIYPAKGLWGVLRTIFGSWVLPNGLMPRHFHEGVATFLETKLTQGGRGKSSHYKMNRRMAVLSGDWGREYLPKDRMEGISTIFPYGRTPYFFGYYLVEELWKKKGRKGVYEWTDSSSSNWPYFLNIPFNEVYAKDSDEIWLDVFNKNRKIAKREIREIRKTPLSKLKYLTKTGHGKKGLALSPNGSLLAYHSFDPDIGTRIILKSTRGSNTEVIDQSGVGSGGLCFLSNSKIAFITSQTENRYQTQSLSIYDLEKESLEVFSQPWAKHAHFVHCQGNSILLYTERAGRGEVKHILFDSKRVVARWKIPQGSWVSGLLVGKQKWIALREGMVTTLFQWRGRSPVRLNSFKGHVHHLVSGAGEIEFVGDFEGREEAWAYQLGSKSLKKRIGVLGGINSFQSRRGKYYLLNYRHAGYELVEATAVKGRSKNGYLVSRPRNALPLSANAKIRVSAEEEYSPWSTILPRAWIPNLFFVPDGAQISAVVLGYDIAQKHHYSLLGGYDTRGTGFGSASYTYRFGKNSDVNLGLFYSPSYLRALQEFYTRWGTSVSFNTYLSFLEMALSIGPRFRKAEDSIRSPKHQSVGVSVGLSKSMGLKSRPTSITPIAGTVIRLNHTQYFKALGSDDDYFETTASLDQYVEAPWWRNHVFKLSGRMGWSEGAPLLNSFYQGGGDLPLYQSRDTYLTRGFSQGAFAGRRIFSAHLEYRFPVWKIERGPGYWPFFLERFHMAFINDWLTRDRGFDHPSDTIFLSKEKFFKEFFGSVGVEFKTDWTLFFYLPAQVRLGLYHGFGDRGKNLYMTLGLQASL